MINLASTNDKKVEKIDVMLKFVQICSYFDKYFSDSVGKLKAFLGKFSSIHFLVQFADTLSRSLQGKSHYFLIS